jgi:hypothetical protein
VLDWNDFAHVAAGNAPGAPHQHTFRETKYAGRVRTALEAILEVPLFFSAWSLEFAASVLGQDIDRLLNRLLREAVRKGVVRPYHF